MTQPLQYGFKKETIVADGRVTQSHIDDLMVWSNMVECPNLTEEQIVIFLLSCDNDVDKAKNALCAFYKSRKNSPEFFNNRDVEGDSMRRILKLYQVGVAPKRTSDGCVLVFASPENAPFSEFNFDEALKLLLIAIDSALYDDPPNAIRIFIDFKGVTLMHLTKFRIGTIRKILFYFEEAIPVKLRAIHMMNTVYFMDKIMALFRPFMKKQLLDLIHFHATSADMDQFYKDHVPG